jgi:hypothetical protein
MDSEGHATAMTRDIPMKARRIDMHHHVVPRVYREAMVEAG